MRTKFDEELHQLQNYFKRMLTETYRALLKVKEAFDEHKTDLAEFIMANDENINAMEVHIELTCARLLALQQPVISDLRYIVSIMKSCSDIERMADHIAAIAKNVIFLDPAEKNLQVESQIDDMINAVIEMLQALHQSLEQLDEEAARKVAMMDNVVDNYRNTLRPEIVLTMQQNQLSVANGTQYMDIVMHLERVADYITNVCERIVYIKTHRIVELNM